MESNQESMVTLTGSDQVVRELAHPATGAIEAEKVTITDNKEAGVYELWVDGQTAAGLLYNEAGTRVTCLAMRSTLRRETPSAPSNAITTVRGLTSCRAAMTSCRIRANSDLRDRKLSIPLIR